MQNETKSLGARRWIAILLIGLCGQIAWAIENNYINLWVYSQSFDASHITWMTMASAVVATLTTFFIGALSDKLGKRKIFISVGYTLWGISVFAFGLMSLDNMKTLAGGDLEIAILLVGVMNVIVDCVMTFFGSTANDACFNAYVTDETNEKNRPFVESVLSVMPVISLAIMLGVGTMLGVPGEQGSLGKTEFASAQAKPWLIFFLAFGIFTTLVGIISFFLLPKDHIKPNREDHYFKHMVKGFFPKTIKDNKLFYICLLTFLFFNVAVDSFMPYIMVYIQGLPSVTTGLGFLPSMAIIFATGTAIVILIGAFLNRIGSRKVIHPSIVLMGLGALALFLAQSDSYVWLLLGGIALISGYLVGTAALGAKIRDLTPAHDVGAFQSVRMVFVVMIPMIVGSNISLAFFGETGVIDPSTGTNERPPNRMMFIVTIASLVLALIPATWLYIEDSRKTSDIDGVKLD